jgi:hypothetical protein
MDHAVSGLGFLTPHVVEFFGGSGERRLGIDLLSGQPEAQSAWHSQHLNEAAQSVHRRFLQILSREGFTIADLRAGRLEFTGQGSSEFTCDCTLESAAGIQFVASMNSKTYWQPTNTDPFEPIKRLRGAG